jgi:uncharacterized protein
MDLRKRLARLDRQGAAGRKSPAADSHGGDPRELGLERRDGKAGPVWIREHATRNPRPPADVVRLNRLTTRSAPDDLTPDEILFLDTETTGLAGGTGTLAFLVGLAWWREGYFHIKQYFVPAPGAERAMLADLAELAADFRVVVTYNGQTFDLPLLRTRGILVRRRNLLGNLASWDLLPVARRLWGRRLADCCQQTVETALAGIHRGAGDIEGQLIPPAYFAFVKTGRSEALRAVIEHNKRDMAGMAAILREAVARARLLTRPTTRRNLPWRDAWSLARLCESAGDRDHEARWMARALDDAWSDDGPPRRFLIDAVRMIKRTGAWDRVVELLVWAEQSHGRAPWSDLEGAILYEHRLVDLARALAYARALGDPHRIARIEAKIETAAKHDVK